MSAAHLKPRRAPSFSMVKLIGPTGIESNAPLIRPVSAADVNGGRWNMEGYFGLRIERVSTTLLERRLAVGLGSRPDRVRPVGFRWREADCKSAPRASVVRRERFWPIGRPWILDFEMASDFGHSDFHRISDFGFRILCPHVPPPRAVSPSSSSSSSSISRRIWREMRGRIKPYTR